MEASHCREIGGETFAASCFQLLDEKLNVGGDDFFGGLGFGCDWKGSDVAVAEVDAAHGVIPPFLNGCAVAVSHRHALALAHASRGGKCKRRGSPPLQRSDSGTERAERSGGLHKRSAEDRGASCIAPGTESLRRSGYLALREAQELIAFLHWGRRGGQEQARGGGCRRTAKPAEAGRRPPPSGVSFQMHQRRLMLLRCLHRPLPNSPRA